MTPLFPAFNIFPFCFNYIVVAQSAFHLLTNISEFIMFIILLAIAPWMCVWWDLKCSWIAVPLHSGFPVK